MNETPSTTHKYYTRFSRSQRWEHLLLLISFTALTFTGIPQKYVPAPWAEIAIAVMGGIEVVRVVHRISAIVLILVSAYHVLGLIYMMYVRRTPLYMLPTFKDVIDFLDSVRWNLGLARRRPQYDRFNFEEKLEYWAVVWGTAVMVVTGFMLWNPVSTTKILPGDFIPAAKAAHGGEAVLAGLAILVWHFYNVHVKTFNKSIFTGKIDREEMEHEHPVELARIEAGKVRPDPPRETIRKRERLFLPLAAIASIITIIVLIIFVTYEDTAIATVPPQPEVVEAYVPATPTPTPGPQKEQTLWLSQNEAVPIPHDIAEGRENCLACHGEGAIYPYTAIHAEIRLGNGTCLSCHSLAETGAAPLPTVADIATPSFAHDILPVLQSTCVACHGLNDGLSLLDYESLMAGGEQGPVILPRDPDGSRLLLVQSMPLEAHPTRLSPEEFEKVRAWIAAGAPNN